MMRFIASTIFLYLFLIPAQFVHAAQTQNLYYPGIGSITGQVTTNWDSEHFIFRISMLILIVLFVILFGLFYKKQKTKFLRSLFLFLTILSLIFLFIDYIHPTFLETILRKTRPVGFGSGKAIILPFKGGVDYHQ